MNLLRWLVRRASIKYAVVVVDGNGDVCVMGTRTSKRGADLLARAVQKALDAFDPNDECDVFVDVETAGPPELHYMLAKNRTRRKATP